MSKRRKGNKEMMKEETKSKVAWAVYGIGIILISIAFGLSKGASWGIFALGLGLVAAAFIVFIYE